VHGEVTFATVVILQKLQPFFALIMARIVLKEKMSSDFYFWALLAILAAFLLTFGKTGIDFSSLDFLSNAAFFALVAAFAFGSSTVFGKRLVNNLDFGATTALRFGATSILAFIFILLFNNFGDIKLFDRLHWLYLIIIVFSSGALAMFLYYFGLKRVSASSATICELAWPFSAVILDYIINRNTLNWIQILASVLLLFAFYKVVNREKVRGSLLFKVVNGKSRGKTLGYPTINLDRIDLDIEHGVYFVKAKINNNIYSGLMHFGHKKTFSEPIATEIYFQEFIPNVELSEIELDIREKIRDIKKFVNIEELKKQIEADVKAFL
jgi:uncharacterized membrane protein